MPIFTETPQFNTCQAGLWAKLVGEALSNILRDLLLSGFVDSCSRVMTLNIFHDLLQALVVFRLTHFNLISLTVSPLLFSEAHELSASDCVPIICALMSQSSLTTQKSHLSMFLVICICPYVSSDNAFTVYTESGMLPLQSVYKLYKEK